MQMEMRPPGSSPTPPLSEKPAGVHPMNPPARRGRPHLRPPPALSGQPRHRADLSLSQDTARPPPVHTSGVTPTRRPIPFQAAARAFFRNANKKQRSTARETNSLVRFRSDQPVPQSANKETPHQRTLCPKPPVTSPSFSGTPPRNAKNPAPPAPPRRAHPPPPPPSSESRRGPRGPGPDRGGGKNGRSDLIAARSRTCRRCLCFGRYHYIRYVRHREDPCRIFRQVFSRGGEGGRPEPRPAGRRSIRKEFSVFLTAAPHSAYLDAHV